MDVWLILYFIGYLAKSSGGSSRLGLRTTLVIQEINQIALSQHILFIHIYTKNMKYKKSLTQKDCHSYTVVNTFDYDRS